MIKMSTGGQTIKMDTTSETVKMFNQFTFETKTTGASETFTLPLEVSGSYDFRVEWGDSKIDYITVYNETAVTHTYVDSGTYVVRISGTIQGFRFNNGGDKTKIYDIKNWGPLRLGNNNGYFYGCSNLTISATDILDMTGTTTTSNMFYACGLLTTVPSMNSWNMSNIVSIFSMFRNAILFNQDISSWNTSSMSNIGSLFYNAESFNQDIGSWNVSNIINMDTTFTRAYAFNQDISAWNTANVTRMYRMFDGITIFNQDISGWNTGNVTDMRYMFRNVTSFDQNIGAWDITSMTQADDMFNNVTLSTANYDALLIGWEGQVEQPNVTFSAGNSTYTAGGAAATARAALVANGWVITDGGAV